MGREVLKVKVKSSTSDKTHYLEFPAEINLDEYSIVDYSSDLLIDDFMVYEANINQLNSLARMANDLSDDDFKKLNDILSSGEYAFDMNEVLDVISNLDLFEVVYGVNDYYELGKYLAGDDEVDYEKYGEKVFEADNGMFIDGMCLLCEDPCYKKKNWK